MTNEQILKKAIEKAVKNGFSFVDWLNNRNDSLIKAELALGMVESSLMEWAEAIIFSHQFALAFWASQEEVYRCDCSDDFWYGHKFCSKCGKKLKKVKRFDDYFWKKHLKIMVLEENPIKYLEQFLKEQ